jgi:FMN-dependent NADH-azoreductase
MERQERYLQTVFGFVGIPDVRFVRAEGLAMGDAKKAEALAEAAAQAQHAIRSAANQAQ